MKKFWIKVKALFNKVSTWFVKFMHENDKIINEVAPVAINVCNFIKEYNGNDIVLALKTWASSTGIVGSTTVTLVDKFLSDDAMDKIIAGLHIVVDASDTENVATKLQKILTYVKSLETNAKAEAYTTLASMIASDFSDGKLSWIELYDFVKAIYETKSNLKK